MTVIRFADFRVAKVCTDDSRVWLEEKGLNWRDFLKNGIEADTLRQFGDQLERIDRLELAARAREAR